MGGGGVVGKWKTGGREMTRLRIGRAKKKTENQKETKRRRTKRRGEKEGGREEEERSGERKEEGTEDGRTELQQPLVSSKH